MRKYIFVTGGVVSSLGKGITAASLGCILKSRGLKVTIQKLDPYINYDPSTMSPFQHGEVFITEDGAETDLDLGHYERFIDENLTGLNNYTAGKIYWSVIQQERQGKFGGGTVQVIPHITNEIKDMIYDVGEKKDVEVVICEIGGTVGDIESLPFLEAIRQMKTDVGREHVFYIHVTMVPFLPATEELKTKPTQHSVKELRSIGIQPDVIVCRSTYYLTADIKEKIALFCDIDPSEVILNQNMDSIYEIPVLLEQEDLDDIVVNKLGLEADNDKLTEWKETIRRIHNINGEVTIALVGKYVSLKDAYISASEALTHAGLYHNCKINYRWIDDTELETGNVTPSELFKDVDGIIVPGGVGEAEQGIAGKIQVARWARENDVPFLGISTGMHSALVEIAEEMLGWKEAGTQESGENLQSPIICEVSCSDNEKNKVYSGSLNCRLKPGTLTAEAYGEEEVKERHRHNYAFNNEYKEEFAKVGVQFSGESPDDQMVQIFELPAYRWFIATQFHPEFKSRPLRPHPLFKDFIRVAQEFNQEKHKQKNLK